MVLNIPEQIYNKERLPIFHDENRLVEDTKVEESIYRYNIHDI
jgi:hypothetical protein